MREAIGGLGLFQIVIFFLALFSGYLCLSVNSSKAYKVKDEIIRIVEKHNGVNSRSLEEIQNYLTKVGYRTTGSCEGNETGYNASGSRGGFSKGDLFCIEEIPVHSLNVDDPSTLQIPEQSYYRIRVFFRLDLPVFGDVFKYDLSGDTRLLYFPNRDR